MFPTGKKKLPAVAAKNGVGEEKKKEKRARHRLQSPNTRYSTRLSGFTSSCACTITWGISLATFQLAGSSALAWTDVHDSQERGKTFHAGASEEPMQQEGLAVSQHPTHRASLRVSRTRRCCVTLKGRMTRGWWPPALSV